MSFQLPRPEPNMNYDKTHLEDLLKLLKFHTTKLYVKEHGRPPINNRNDVIRRLVIPLVSTIIAAPLGLITLIKWIITGKLPKWLFSIVILLLIGSGWGVYNVAKMVKWIKGADGYYNNIAPQFKDWYINVYSKQNV